MVFSLAERFGESDPRKIANLPAEILLHWEAWFSLSGNAEPPDPAAPVVATNTPADRQCADVMRILGQ
ncbi:hypothetical protein CKQ54_23335 [Rahnella variigena]|uniref:Uncharacterized protein n=1 Tax=Rahnella variigena TaxID=574964 RepID=A0ABX9PPR1_9GAMM|nr:hypothetical protein D6D38_21075 [Rahnella variigena]RKF66329.1 hypothetical protein CKQ54_23335 [Rahnella variigena]